MRMTDLQRELHNVDKAAVLVSPQVLEGVAKEVFRLSGIFWSVPHAHCLVVPRQVLFRHVEQDELDLDPDQLLPDTVLLLVRPPREVLNETEPKNLLLRYWRLLFHAKVHQVLEGLDRLPEEWREKALRIGATEFAEIRAVLVQDHHIPNNADERQVFIEFSALYWEYKFFAPPMLGSSFPILSDLEGVEKLLAEDLDALVVLKQTKLPGAPEPTQPLLDRADESHEYFYRLRELGERASRRGNIVRAAILMRRAARVAPSDQVADTVRLAESRLEQLTGRLKEAFDLSEAEIREWNQVLPILLDKSDQGRLPVEASFLYDLQKACLDFEQEIYALDLGEWIMSGGHRSMKRPLPSQRLVRVARHLRSAAARISMARLSEADRWQLSNLVQQATSRCEERVRKRFRPILVTALEDVGLSPRFPPEVVAFNRVVEELLGRIVDNGFFTFMELRDVISNNQLKLPDLVEPQDFIKGDPLLRLDRRLGGLLDGVYRPGEIYMRVLERFTALNFGTKLGRWLTLFVTLPFGGAFLGVEFVEIIMGWFGFVFTTMAKWSLVSSLGVFMLGLIHSGEVRRRTQTALHDIWNPMRFLFFEAPVLLIKNPYVRRGIKSWPFQLFFWFALQPLGVCAALLYFMPDVSWTTLFFVFLAALIVFNSRVGLSTMRLVGDSIGDFSRMIRSGLIVGLVQFFAWLFQQILHGLEWTLFTVDEFLRFRSSESWWSMTIRGILYLIWFPVSYVLRFYIVVLIEPCLNPLKFPVCSIATKLLLPFLPIWAGMLTGYLTPITGLYLAGLIAGGTIFLLPDAFGFLFWEMKENWKLYRTNRSQWLQPVQIGPHGETMLRLLKPGFHSGIVPKLFGKLRKATETSTDTGNSRDYRQVKQKLEEIANQIRFFAQYELVELVLQAKSWHAVKVRVSQVTLATRRIRIELSIDHNSDGPLTLDFEERSGWLSAHISRTGWLESLTHEQKLAFNTSLAIFYKRAGVDLVREQWLQLLPDTVTGGDLDNGRLTLWTGPNKSAVMAYDLDPTKDRFAPIMLDGVPASSWPTLPARQVMFGRLPLSWDDMMLRWRSDQIGKGHPPLVVEEQEIDLLSPARPSFETQTPPDSLAG